MAGLPFLLAAALFAQDSPPKVSLHAAHTEIPPSIDGRLDEPAWRSADVATNFRQRDPAEGAPATQRTEVRVLYDNSSLYVGAQLFDDEPGKIVKRLSRRDDEADADRFAFYLDALHDHLTGAMFEVSAAGVQRDAIISNDVNMDFSWDAVWESAVTVDSTGWTVEIRIPLSDLRFVGSAHQTWSFNAQRLIQRNHENDWYELTPRNEQGLASRMRDLTDIDGIVPRTTREVVPYAVARTDRDNPLAGNPFDDGSRYSATAGFDLKYSLRPNVILNATVNPDFGQVEIDPAVVNLGAFETFYPEKRSFFIEGSQIFSNFGYLGANNRMGFNRQEPDLIHTRRIGRVPQGTAFGDFVNSPSATTILGAAKITGKTSHGWTFGVLEAVTGREYAKVSNAGQNSRTEVEPLTNYAAVRLLKEWGDGRSGVGTLFTSVNRDLRNPELRDLLTSRANVVGVDGYHFLDSRRDWVINGRFAVSDVAGTPGAIDRLQLEPQRYFQRPDTPEVSFDSSRTSLRGWNGDINLNRNQGARTLNAAVWAVSPGFESGDLGFHYNGDVWGSHVSFDWKQIHPDRFTRDRNITIAKFYVWDYGGARLGDGVMSFGNFTLLNYWGGGGSVGLFRKVQDDRLTRGGPPAAQLPNGFVSLYLFSDSRKSVVLHVNGERDWDDAGGGGANGSLSVEWKPSPRLNLSSGPSYSHGFTGAQYVTTSDDPTATATYGKRYQFAHLGQSQFSLDTRVNFLFSSKASLQMFVQPLVVAGEYTDFKALSRPKTFDFEPYSNVPFNPDFNFKSLRVNAIFRWEWKLGSTLYVAWTQQRQDLSNPGQFQLGRDLRGVFAGPADNVFLIKLSRWFSL